MQIAFKLSLSQLASWQVLQALKLKNEELFMKIPHLIFLKQLDRKLKHPTYISFTLLNYNERQVYLQINIKKTNGHFKLLLGIKCITVRRITNSCAFSSHFIIHLSKFRIIIFVTFKHTNLQHSMLRPQSTMIFPRCLPWVCSFCFASAPGCNFKSTVRRQWKRAVYALRSVFFSVYFKVFF